MAMRDERDCGFGAEYCAQRSWPKLRESPQLTRFPLDPMVSKTLKRQKRKAVQKTERSSAILSKIETNVGRTVGAKVRMTHKMKSKRKYRIGGASPDDMY